MPATPAASSSSQDGLLVFSGAFGSAWRDGKQLADVTEASGTVEIAQITVPIVGQTNQGLKPGRETRSGTIRVQKRDAGWEMEVYQFLSQSLADRRAARDSGQPILRPFSLILEYDDPYTLGRERWQLDGVMLWRLTLGMALATDAVEVEYPITWEAERPLEAFSADVGPGGVPVPNWFIGPTP